MKNFLALLSALVFGGLPLLLVLAIFKQVIGPLHLTTDLANLAKAILSIGVIIMGAGTCVVFGLVGAALGAALAEWWQQEKK